MVLPDHDNVKPAKVRRVVLCYGKVYYDLIARSKLQDELESESSLNSSLSELAIIRVEQLYPFPEDVLSLILSRYKKVKTFVWCQESYKTKVLGLS